MENIDRVVGELAQCQSAITSIYIFGSRALGTNSAKSDLDLAVLLAEGDNVPSFSVLDFIVDVENATGLQTDVTILNRAGEMLKYEVRKKGQVIYDKDPITRKRFEVLGRKKFEDFLYIHNRYVNQVIYGGS